MSNCFFSCIVREITLRAVYSITYLLFVADVVVIFHWNLSGMRKQKEYYTLVTNEFAAMVLQNKQFNGVHLYLSILICHLNLSLITIDYTSLYHA